MHMVMTLFAHLSKDSKIYYLLISRMSKFHGPFSTFKFQPETLADVD